MTVDIGEFETNVSEFMVINTPEFSSEIISSYLNNLKENTSIVFFGCGRTGEILVDYYSESLERHHTQFVTSYSKKGEFFRNYPLRELSDLLDNYPEYIIILSTVYEQEMLDSITQIPRQRIKTIAEITKETDCRDIIKKAREYIKNSVLENDISTINRFNTDNKKIVCFTTINTSHNFLKIMLGLKKQGYLVILVLNNKIINNAFSIEKFKGEGYYDYLYITKYSYSLELLQILQSCNVSFVHAVASMAENISLAYVIANSPCPVVVEYCDVKQLVFEGNDELAQNQLGLTPSALEIEKTAQEIVYTESNGILIKDSPEIIDHLEDLYGKRPNWLHFFPYSCNEFVVPLTSEKFSQKSGKIHIVYAGCLHNNPKWHPTPIFKSTLKAIEQLSDQEIYFSIYNAMDSTGQGFEEYLELSEKNDFFNYHFALPYDQLSIVLSKYDFGWFCFDFSNALESSFFHKTTFGSKIFTYIEAGLPVLVSPEQAYMSSVVEDLGVGQPLQFNDIANLSNIIGEMDIQTYKANIDRVRREKSLDIEIPRIVEFYKYTGLETHNSQIPQDVLL